MCCIPINETTGKYRVYDRLIDEGVFSALYFAKVGVLSLSERPHIQVVTCQVTMFSMMLGFRV